MRRVENGIPPSILYSAPIGANMLMNIDRKGGIM